MKFALRYSDVVNGKFITGRYNLVMVFQVNCPGCFIHGFPLMNELKVTYGDSISFFALSTAFEDFDLNTAENTRLLVNDGTFVGEPRKAFEGELVQCIGNKVTFPVLIDLLVHQSELLHPEFIENIIQSNAAGAKVASQKKKTCVVCCSTTLVNYPGADIHLHPT